MSYVLLTALYYPSTALRMIPVKYKLHVHNMMQAIYSEIKAFPIIFYLIRVLYTICVINLKFVLSTGDALSNKLGQNYFGHSFNA